VAGSLQRAEPVAGERIGGPMSEDERLAWLVKHAKHKGVSAKVFLIMGSPTGVVRVYRRGVLVMERPIGIPEIAMFAAGREDLIDAFMDTLVQEESQ